MSEAKKALDRKRKRTETTPDLPEPSAPNQKSPISESLKKPKRYPHRISFDITEEMYEQLRERAFKTRRTMNDIIRSAIEADNRKQSNT